MSRVLCRLCARLVSSGLSSTHEGWRTQTPRFFRAKQRDVPSFPFTFFFGTSRTADSPSFKGKTPLPSPPEEEKGEEERAPARPAAVAAAEEEEEEREDDGTRSYCPANRTRVRARRRTARHTGWRKKWSCRPV